MDQIELNSFGSESVSDMLQNHSKTLWTVATVMASATLLGAGAFLVWNSRQAKMLRAAKRASKILYKAGTILQSVAEVAD